MCVGGALRASREGVTETRESGERARPLPQGSCEPCVMTRRLDPPRSTIPTREQSAKESSNQYLLVTLKDNTNRGDGGAKAAGSSFEP